MSSPTTSSHVGVTVYLAAVRALKDAGIKLQKMVEDVGRMVPLIEGEKWKNVTVVNDGQTADAAARPNTANLFHWPSKGDLLAAFDAWRQAKTAAEDAWKRVPVAFQFAFHPPTAYYEPAAKAAAVPPGPPPGDRPTPTRSDTRAP